MKSRQSWYPSHRKRCTAMVAAGMLVGQMAACMTPQEQVEREPPSAGEPLPEPALSSHTSTLTATEYALASLLNVSQPLGADANCTPAPRGGMSDGVTALTAVYNSQPNQDDLANSPEVIWITGHVPGMGGVITCGYTRTAPDETDPYLGWRRSAMIAPPFELMMPCAVMVPFMPSEQLPWEMLGAYAAGAELEECTGTPPPIDEGGGDGGGGDDGGGDDGGGGPPPPPPPPPGGGGGGPILESLPGAAISISLPPVPMLEQAAATTSPDRTVAALDAITQQVIADLLVEAPELADDVAMLRANMPATLEAIHDSGRYADLGPVERARAELTEATSTLLPHVAQPPRDGSTPVSIQTGGTHCVPCVGYVLITIGELMGTIAYVGKVAKAKNADEKEDAWWYLRGLFLAVVGTSIVAIWYCTTCPPVMAAIAYIGTLITRLTQMAFYTFMCVATTILGTPVCI
jgi:hypothetical protein